MVAIVDVRQSGRLEVVPTDQCQGGASGGGTRYPHTGTPLPTTTTTTTHRQAAMAATLAEGQAVQGRYLAAGRAGDTATAAALHDRLNRLTREYLAMAVAEEGETVPDRSAR